MVQILKELNRNAEFFVKRWYLSICIIAIVGLIIRLYYLPYNLPVILDAQQFFWYANDLVILGKFRYMDSPHIVWPGFLSIFFLLSHSDNFLDYMNIQRLVTIFLSMITIIPVYFLCKKFFNPKIALVGAALFIFEPRLIQNSLSGLAEPLFIFLISVSLLFFLNKNKKIVYISFIIVGLVSLVRPEGIFVFFALSILFFIKYKKEKKVILQYIFVLSLFILTLLPIGIIREDLGMGDPITGRLIGESSYQIENLSKENTNFANYFSNGFGNSIKLFGWSLIPLFVVFILPGLFLIFRKFNDKSVFLTIVGFSMLIPIFHALSRGADTRYVFPLYPVLIVVSLYFISYISNKFRYDNLFLILIILGLLIASLMFLDYKMIDKNHEFESMKISFKINELTQTINSYYPETVYLNIPSMIKEKFPVLYSDFEDRSPKVIDVQANSIDAYIKACKELGITHLVVDDRDYSLKNMQFLSNVFDNDQDYPYLIKEYDSIEDGFTYHLKIFKIDYNVFEHQK